MVHKQIAQYVITEELGKGGMGVVYKARDAKLDRFVALKLLPSLSTQDANERKRMLQEARAAAALNHPNVCTIYEVQDEGDHPYIAMEFVEGVTLRKKMEDPGPDGLSVGQIISYAIQISEALQEAHNKGIVHRDIKSENIIITPRNTVKVMDFGLAKIYSESQAVSMQSTASGNISGTLAYMSPEQLQGNKLDGRTDMFSTGVVLYELLTGRVPFSGQYPTSIMYSIVNEDPEPVTRYNQDVPEKLVEIVNRSTAKSPDNRYRTMEEMAAELRTVGASEGQSLPAGALHLTSTTSKKIRYTTRSLKRALAERRQMTVVSCSMSVRSSASDEPDPEDLHEVLPAYKDLCRKIVSRFEGFIARDQENDIQIYFGVPIAHEDDARRAVLTGLHILEGVGWLNAGLKKDRGIFLNLRIGIHSGLVITGEIGDEKNRSSAGVIGETPAIANRLISIAEADSVCVSVDTYELVKGYFECNMIGEYPVKGSSEKTPVYRVLHESTARTRRDAEPEKGRIPFIGREREVELMFDCWKRSVEGVGQVVQLAGEAGIGKSRLIGELKARIADDPGAWLTECTCSPYHQSTPLHPVIELYEGVILGFEPGATPEKKIMKLEGFLAQYGLPVQEAAPLFASFLSIPTGDRYPALNLSPERHRQKIMELLLTILLERASRQPVLLVIDDLHWADPTTLELVSMLIDQGPTTHLLTLLNFRTEFIPPWSMRSYITQISLNRLSKTEIENMITRIAGGKKLPAGIVAEIVNKTDGIPLFIEELTKMVLESGIVTPKNGTYELSGSAQRLSIPNTLRDSLMARLDRLGPAKELAQIAGVIGREFSHKLLQLVSGWDQSDLDQELQVLLDAELIYKRGFSTQSTYSFKHALIRDIAYQSLLKGDRKEYHCRIARSITEHFPELAEGSPEILAHHYTDGGMIPEGQNEWQRAGMNASGRSAHVEAIDHFNKALDLLRKQPDSIEMQQQELTLQLFLAKSLMMTRGYSSPDVERTFGRARQICTALGEPPQLFFVIWGFWAYYLVRAQFSDALREAEQLLKMAEISNDPKLSMEAHTALGATYYWTGVFDKSLIHLEQALELHRAYPDDGHLEFTGQDSGIFIYGYLALLLTVNGSPGRARLIERDAVEKARKLNHPYSLAYLLGFVTTQNQLFRDLDATLRMAEETISISAEQRFPTWLTIGTMHKGWVLSCRNNPQEGLKLLKEGAATYESLGALCWHTQYMTLIAEAHNLNNEPEEALQWLDKALDEAQKTGEDYYRAETLRIKALVYRRLFPDDFEKTEEYLLLSLETARAQHGRAFELRTAVTLSEMWRERGSMHRASDLLKKVIGEFSDGIDIPELADARELLSSLQNSIGN